MTDTERLDWLSSMLGAAVCELMFKSGMRVPVHARLRETIDVAMEDTKPFLTKSISVHAAGTENAD